jgi:agmatinase
MIILPEKSNFLMIGKKYSNYQDSKIAIVSAPYEASVSYGKGTASGPKAIIDASHYVEFYDEEQDRELCFEEGITTIKELNIKKMKSAKALDTIRQTVEQLIIDKKFVVLLGGEHTVSVPSIAAHYKHYKDFSILHFDAHSDLRESYQNNPFSHASAFARVCDFFPPEKIAQVGIRAQCIEESKFIKQNKINTFYAWQIRTNKYGQNWQKEIVKRLNKKIYISFDIDFFDPSIMPATGTPEPDGFLWSETMDIFREIKKAGKQIIGFDMVEFAPVKGMHHPDMLAAKLVYKLLNFAF